MECVLNPGPGHYPELTMKTVDRSSIVIDPKDLIRKKQTLGSFSK